MQTIRDAHDHLVELEPETPRTADELRDYIHEKNLRYDELDQAFWDDMFESGWPYGD